MKTLRVAVVGAGGGIGRTLVERLAMNPSIDVQAVCRNEVTAAALRIAGFDVRCGSVADPRSAAELLSDRTVVVNCSSASGLPGTARVEDRANVRGMLAVDGPRRFIHFSSVAVYGTCINRRNTFDRPRPDMPYGRDKLNLEGFVRGLAGARGHELVVIRLGHVYGAEQWVSRFVLDALARPGWRLPYDGLRPSNAVHVKNVAAAVHGLVIGHETGTFNLFDAPQSTWRQIFDWNTRAIGASPIRALDAATSSRLAAHFSKVARAPLAQVFREVAAWGGTLPLSLFSASPALRFMGLSVLSTLSSPRLEARVLKTFAHAQLKRRPAEPTVTEPWLFSNEAPGPVLGYEPELRPEDAESVAHWYASYSNPDALAPFEYAGSAPSEARA